MRIDRRLLSWGLFFILLGAIPLAVRQGYLTEASLERWWSLWPLLLVGAGLGLLLRRTPFEFIGGLLAAGTVGVMAGSVLAVGFGGFPIAGCGDERGTVAFQTREGELSAGADVRLELNCGELTVVRRRLDGESRSTTTAPVRGSTPRRRAHRAVCGRENRHHSGQRDRWTVTLPGTLASISTSRSMPPRYLDLADGTFGRVAIDPTWGHDHDAAGDGARRGRHRQRRFGESRAARPSLQASLSVNRLDLVLRPVRRRPPIRRTTTSP
jgi:hypothetical protein